MDDARREAARPGCARGAPFFGDRGWLEIPVPGCGPLPGDHLPGWSGWRGDDDTIRPERGRKPGKAFDAPPGGSPYGLP